MNTGVYLIRNTVNGLVYVGCSTKPAFRWQTHRQFLRRRAHNNVQLQTDWIDFGEDAFVFEVAEEVEDIAVAHIREFDWLNRMRDEVGVYNIQRHTNPLKPGGGCGPGGMPVIEHYGSKPVDSSRFEGNAEWTRKYQQAKRTRKMNEWRAQRSEATA